MIETTTEIATYSVPEVNLPRLKERIAKLNKRAKKLGVAEVELSIEFDCIRHEFVFNSYGFGEDKSWVAEDAIESLKAKGKGHPTGNKMGYYSVVVSGDTPKYDGWQFIATLETVVTDDGVAENLIKTVPGATCPQEYAHRFGECDQCKLVRRRNETFVVKHESGEYKVVGRSCIADFLGGVNPANIANQAQWLIEIGEACEEYECFEWGGSTGPTGEDLLDLLSWTAGAIQHLGWRSKSSCEFGGMPTASAVIQAMNPHPMEHSSVGEMRAKIAPSEDNKATAEAAIEWARSISDEDVESSSYMQNCRLISKCSWCSYKNVGIAVSIVSSYLRHVDRLKEQERKASRPESHHVGVLKKRMEMVVTCEKIIKCDGMYGLTGIHKMVDEHGNDLVWFASGDSSKWLDEDCKYLVKATPTKHGEFKDRKQTTVNRVAVVKELSEVAIGGDELPEGHVEGEVREVPAEKVW